MGALTVVMGAVLFLAAGDVIPQSDEKFGARLAVPEVLDFGRRGRDRGAKPGRRYGLAPRKGFRGS